MGNAEARALTQSSPLVADEVYAAHRQYLDYNRDFHLDRHAFGLLFHTDHISFQLIDQLFESLTGAGNDPTLHLSGSGGAPKTTVPFADLAVGLVSGAAAIPLERKLNILFDAIDANGDGELVPEEVRSAFSSFLVGSVQRLRGVDAGNGRVRYTDRRCAGCREAPINLVYECLDCQQGFALGVPITVHLCKQCAPTWEGYGCNAHDMLHSAKSHTLVKGRAAPNPHVVTHEGVQCNVCEMLPIVGNRYRCLDCNDMTNLCEDCYASGEQPGSHRTGHTVDRLTKAVSLEAEVQHFTNRILSSLDTNADGQITREEFLDWGLHNELASCLLRGFHIHDVRILPFVEGCERQITTVAGAVSGS